MYEILPKALLLCKQLLDCRNIFLMIHQGNTFRVISPDHPPFVVKSLRTLYTTGLRSEFPVHILSSRDVMLDESSTHELERITGITIHSAICQRIQTEFSRQKALLLAVNKGARRQYAAIFDNQDTQTISHLKPFLSRLWKHESEFAMGKNKFESFLRLARSALQWQRENASLIHHNRILQSSIDRLRKFVPEHFRNNSESQSAPGLSFEPENFGILVIRADFRILQEPQIRDCLLTQILNLAEFHGGWLHSHLGSRILLLFNGAEECMEAALNLQEMFRLFNHIRESADATPIDFKLVADFNTLQAGSNSGRKSSYFSVQGSALLQCEEILENSPGGELNSSSSLLIRVRPSTEYTTTEFSPGWCTVLPLRVREWHEDLKQMDSSAKIY